MQSVYPYEAERENQDWCAASIHWHHLSQGTMTAPNHVIQSCDPAGFSRNYWQFLFYPPVEARTDNVKTLQPQSDEGRDCMTESFNLIAKKNPILQSCSHAEAPQELTNSRQNLGHLPQKIFCIYQTTAF